MSMTALDLIHEIKDIKKTEVELRSYKYCFLQEMVEEKPCEEYNCTVCRWAYFDIEQRNRMRLWA